ncbi:hypothetical protein [Francisella sp. SYW-9]|uniref:hypothetical protein n=1 Tax=Francisella sp. SYW-9 TaxID=2610888 RepID=UPI001CD0706B|nr:hypothetical protein [Francisella sp. SYW-9]
MKFRKFFTVNRGRRFYLLHRYTRRKLSNPFILILSLVISFIVFIPGVIMLFTPGPGLLFIVLALLPFIAISKKFAQLLDNLEIYFWKKLVKLKDRFHKRK